MTAFANRNLDGTDTDIWLTPPEIIRALGPFDLDPCAVPEPRPWPTAARHYTKEDDGLKLPWSGYVWCNPPYRQAKDFMRLLAAHHNGVALVFARTDTHWFHRYIFEAADAVLFLEGRLSFYCPDGTKGRANAGAPSCLPAYGWRAVEALTNCGLKGKLVLLGR